MVVLVFMMELMVMVLVVAVLMLLLASDRHPHVGARVHLLDPDLVTASPVHVGSGGSAGRW